VTEVGYATPEEAALAAVAGKPARPVFANVSLDDAMVLLSIGRQSQAYGYQVETYRVSDRWFEGASSNGYSTGYTASGRLVLTFWDRAPLGAKFARVHYRGLVHECPVIERYFFLVVWDPTDVNYPSERELYVEDFIN
jgi:hypothetical protein